MKLRHLELGGATGAVCVKDHKDLHLDQSCAEMDQLACTITEYVHANHPVWGSALTNELERHAGQLIRPDACTSLLTRDDIGMVSCPK